MNTDELYTQRLRSISHILIADDDFDDQELIRDALLENKFSIEKLRFVNDGQELLDTLDSAQTLPSMIILDLNMPRISGREALAKIKQSDRLRHIPIIIFTTSDSDVDIRQCYTTGSNAFMTKPNNYHELVEAMKMLSLYWIGQARIVLN